MLLGLIDSYYLLASECRAFSTIGAQILCDIQPGEIVYLHEEGYYIVQGFPPQTRALCTFEHIYIDNTPFEGVFG